MTLVCSNCGEKRTVETIPEAEQAVRDGWKVVGDAEYCPECSRTWKDRNGREIPSSETGSYWRIRALMVAKEAEK